MKTYYYVILSNLLFSFLAFNFVGWMDSCSSYFLNIRAGNLLIVGWAINIVNKNDMQRTFFLSSRLVFVLFHSSRTPNFPFSILLALANFRYYFLHILLILALKTPSKFIDLRQAVSALNNSIGNNLEATILGQLFFFWPFHF